jgi:hypothetical protein
MQNINLNNLTELKVKSSSSSAQSILFNGLKKVAKQLKKLVVTAFLFVKNTFKKLDEKISNHFLSYDVVQVKVYALKNNKKGRG